MRTLLFELSCPSYNIMDECYYYSSSKKRVENHSRKIPAIKQQSMKRFEQLSGTLSMADRHKNQYPKTGKYNPGALMKSNS